VNGGRVDQVLADWPVAVVVFDNDIEGLIDEEIISVLDEDSYVSVCFENGEEDVGRQVFMDVGR
jgi:hypothetical protein